MSEPGNIPDPVSYTHLDVYKRQCLGWAADENASSDPKNAPGLSQTVLNNNEDYHGGNTSLDYLFDLTENDNKRSYENVTGLFQVDEDGYYYYDARKNFAEFRESNGTSKDGKPSDGSFILYDGPAVWLSLIHIYALSDDLEVGTVDAVAMDGAITKTYKNDERNILDFNVSEQQYGVATQKLSLIHI